MTRPIHLKIDLTLPFGFCILWIAGVPKVNGWVVLAPIWIGLLVAVAASSVARMIRWWPGSHARRARERGLV